jgi:hypothetical protein
VENGGQSFALSKNLHPNSVDFKLTTSNHLTIKKLSLLCFTLLDCQKPRKATV